MISVTQMPATIIQQQLYYCFAFDASHLRHVLQVIMHMLCVMYLD